MAMKPCRECKKEISSDADVCPLCGKKSPHGRSKIVIFGGGLLGLVFGLTAIGMLSGGAERTVERHAEQEGARIMGDVQKQVANDAVAQYEIAKRNNDPVQVCVQAGMVAAAFLQAKDEPNFNKWKAVEKADCGRAGLAH